MNMARLKYFLNSSETSDPAEQSGDIGAYCDNENCPNKKY